MDTSQEIMTNRLVAVILYQMDEYGNIISFDTVMIDFETNQIWIPGNISDLDDENCYTDLHDNHYRTI